MNLVETFEKPNFNQSCAYGNLIEGHAVYCHCKNINAPRKCKRTWYTKGIIKDEDCQFYKPNRLVNYPPTPEAMGWASRVNAPTNVGNLP